MSTLPRKLQLSSLPVRWIVSVAIVVHFCVILSNWVSQRGTSYFIDSFLERVATYSALGNLRSDATALSLATGMQLSEDLLVEVQLQNDDARWSRVHLDPIALVDPSDQTSSWRPTSLERSWLQQLSGLLYFENDDGVGRMLISILSRLPTQPDRPMGRIRIRVAPRPTQDQFEAMKQAGEDRSIRTALEPQVVYTANIIDLGDGQISLLPQLEERRASKSLAPPSVP